MGKWSIRRLAIQKSNKKRATKKMIQLSKDQKNIPPEYNKLVNENFWSLV